MQDPPFLQGLGSQGEVGTDADRKYTSYRHNCRGEAKGSKYVGQPSLIFCLVVCLVVWLVGWLVGWFLGCILEKLSSSPL